MYYAVGDTPAAPVAVLPTRDGDAVDVDDYATADAQLIQPDGTIVTADAVIVPSTVPDGPAVEVTLPQLTQAGLVGLSLQLSTTAGEQDTFDVEPIVVELRDGWHTIGSARGQWPAAYGLSDPRLYTLLVAARTACLAYQPAAATRRPLPTELEAQLLQARNRNAASHIDPASGSDGVDGYGATVYPMDWAVKALLRPVGRFGAIR